MRRIQLSESLLESITVTVPMEKTKLDPLKPLCVEIGCGNGLFLMQAALNMPLKNFIGCEIKKDRYLRTAKRITHHQLPNAFVALMPGQELLDAIDDNSLDTFYMNFPDPWPKKRHHKRRFFYDQSILDLIIKKLKPKGKLYFASDHEEYFFFVLNERLMCNPNLFTNLKNGYTHSLEAYFSTLYEAKWKEENRTLYYTLFQKQ